jgi:hypothetical protein
VRAYADSGDTDILRSAASDSRRVSVKGTRDSTALSDKSQ